MISTALSMAVPAVAVERDATEAMPFRSRSESPSATATCLGLPMPRFSAKSCQQHRLVPLSARLNAEAEGQPAVRKSEVGALYAGGACVLQEAGYADAAEPARRSRGSPPFGKGVVALDSSSARSRMASNSPLSWVVPTGVACGIAPAGTRLRRRSSIASMPVCRAGSLDEPFHHVVGFRPARAAG